MTIWYVLLVILGISVLVVTHELGHYLMGKWLGFTIVEFSVGLGPKLFGVKGKETEFTLRALPIGGSCRFFGEDGNDEEEPKSHPEAFSEDVEKPEKKPKEPDPRLFSSKPAWKRFLVVAAGPVVNILTCVVLCFVMLLINGELLFQTSKQILVVSEVVERGPAEKAGMEVGDILVSIDGTELTDTEDVSKALAAASMDGMTVTVLRGATVDKTETKDGKRITTERTVTGGTLETLTFGSLLDQKTGEKRMQIQFRFPSAVEITQRNTVWEAAYKAFPETWNMAKAIYESLGMLISGQANCSELSGTLGTVDYVSDEMAEAETASDAFDLFLWFMALIAVNLGIVNLLPLPALDGGRLIFIIVEMIRRKPVPPEKEGMVHLIGMVLLLLLMLALTIGDLIRCFGG